MSLCENLATSASLQDLARKIALLLGTPECLDSITGLLTTQSTISESAQPEVFSFKWIVQFHQLAEELSKTTSKEVKEKLALAGMNTRRPRPKEPGTLPAVLLINQAMFTSAKDRPFLLLPLPISDDAHQEIIRRVRTRYPHIKEVDLSTLKDAKLQLQSDTKRNVRSEATFQPDSVSLVSECVRVRTTPSLIPFLMLPFPTERQQDGKDEV
ncbi:hypothetical protein CC78DRAFT_622223 [Lojkania enalia]|uniref:Uncharacterized protein n=1 Tax=Lojkania enalia TaxID=147567 RepID=A0A9P4JYB6_9PLEO|nr:hypothetical protein CC78DRAFT_622223 [Didymosphaeria enalia]